MRVHIPLFASFRPGKDTHGCFFSIKGESVETFFGFWTKKWGIGPWACPSACAQRRRRRPKQTHRRTLENFDWPHFQLALKECSSPRACRGMTHAQSNVLSRVKANFVCKSSIQKWEEGLKCDTNAMIWAVFGLEILWIVPVPSDSFIWIVFGAIWRNGARKTKSFASDKSCCNAVMVLVQGD